MSEFKGTTEFVTNNMKWYNKDGRIYHINPSKMYENGGGVAGVKAIATVSADTRYFISGNETQYNSLLISKAPEMLEMLTSFVNGCDEIGFDDIDPEYYYNKFKQLIKEATEL